MSKDYFEAGMPRIFISHSSLNEAEAVEIKDWIEPNGWNAEVFLDLDPERGLVAGEKWVNALKEAVHRIAFGPDFLGLNSRSSSRSNVSMKALTPIGRPVLSCFLKSTISESRASTGKNFPQGNFIIDSNGLILTRRSSLRLTSI